METIDSKIFGKALFLEESDEDLEILKSLIEIYPVNTFGILNKILNSKDYMIELVSLK